MIYQLYCGKLITDFIGKVRVLIMSQTYDQTVVNIKNEIVLAANFPEFLIQGDKALNVGVIADPEFFTSNSVVYLFDTIMRNGLDQLDEYNDKVLVIRDSDKLTDLSGTTNSLLLSKAIVSHIPVVSDVEFTSILTLMRIGNCGIFATTYEAYESLRDPNIVDNVVLFDDLNKVVDVWLTVDAHGELSNRIRTYDPNIKALVRLN